MALAERERETGGESILNCDDRITDTKTASTLVLHEQLARSSP